MMLPGFAVRKLNDHFGFYTINVRCLKCGHTRDIDPKALANIFGWDAELVSITPHFRCSKCSTKNVDVQIGFEKRPRRWNKHP
jgi:hypothetical protein